MGLPLEDKSYSEPKKEASSLSGPVSGPENVGGAKVGAAPKEDLRLASRPRESFFSARDPNSLRWEILLVSLYVAASVVVGDPASIEIGNTAEASAFNPLSLALLFVAAWGITSASIRFNQLRRYARTSIIAPVVVVVSVLVVAVSALVGATSFAQGIGESLYSLVVSAVSLSLFATTLLIAIREFFLARAWNPIEQIGIAWIKETVQSQEVSCPLNAVRPGMLAFSRMNDSIVADGVVVSGAAVIEEIRLGALKHLRVRGEGEWVLAGSKVVSGEVTYRVERGVEESELSHVLGKLTPSDSPANPEGENLWRKLTGVVAWIALFVGVCAVLVWRELGLPTDMAMNIGASVLAITSILWTFEIKRFLPALKLRELFKVDCLVDNCKQVEGISKNSEILVELPKDEPFSGLEISSVELLDPALDRIKIYSVILALLGRSSEDLAQAWEEASGLSASDLIPCRIDGFHDYPGLGLIGVIQNVEFSLGTEEFMLARGCRIEPSDIINQDDDIQPLYLALGEDLVLRCLLGSPKLSQLSNKFSNLRFVSNRSDLSGAEIAKLNKIDLDKLKNGLPSRLSSAVLTDHEGSRKGKAVFISPFGGSMFSFENSAEFLTVGFLSTQTTEANREPLGVLTTKGRLRSLTFGVDKLLRFAKLELFISAVTLGVVSLELILALSGLLPVWAILLTNALATSLISLAILPPERPFGKLAIYSTRAPRF